MNRCPDCGNHFVQPFVCKTCGAQKLYDLTLRLAEERAGKAEAELARITEIATYRGEKITELEKTILEYACKVRKQGEEAERLRKLCAEGGTISGGLEDLTGWINRVIAAGREEG